MKLNIGCGKKILKGYINLDVVKLPGVDIVHDLNKYPWPFKDNYFDEIYADNVLEHLDDIIKPIEEIWRISKKNATIKIIVPFSPTIWAFVDPTHKQFYTHYTFDYFTKDNDLNYYSKARFEIVKKKIIFSKYLKVIEWIVNSNKLCKKIYLHSFYTLIPPMLLYFELKTIK
ncbi:MAG TPA: methyltransferase domain-containing protein [Candidatus Diapherotrites archaeon]|nr:methyltransferase domain-containing protein [Candidatus Diapherotrites archaeon]